MSTRRCYTTTLSVLAFALACATLHAQIAPPNQDFVADIGNAPLKAPATADFAPGNTFTMEGWIFLTGKVSGAWIMGKSLDTNGVDPYVSFALTLGRDDTTLQFIYSSGLAGTFRAVSAPTALPLRTWTHIAAVMEGGTTRLLVNGSVVATGLSVGAPLSAPNVPFSVGTAYLPDEPTGYFPLPVYARQVRFWNIARTTAQIAAARSETLPTDRAGLVAAWPLDESSGSTVRELSGSARTLAATTPITVIRSSLLAAGPFFDVGTNVFPVGSVFNDGSFFINDIVPIDFNGDGKLDLILMGGHMPTYPETRSPLRAFRNNGGSFVDVTSAVLGNVTIGTPSYLKYVGDLNGDGRPDLLIGEFGTDTPPFPGGQSRIFIQTADGRLVDETATRLPRHNLNTHNIAVADIDGNGSPDIYLANVGGSGVAGPLIYLNDGHGFFTEAQGRLPADIAAGDKASPGNVYTACLFLDLNGDGHPDLILGGGGAISVLVPNEVLINNGAGYFHRDSRFVLPPKLFPDDSHSTVTGIYSADFDGDGHPDLLLSNTKGYTAGGAGLQLLSNRGNGTFVDVTAQAGFTWQATDDEVTYVRIVDLNGDGRPDIVALVHGSTGFTGFNARIFLNAGGNHFIDATTASQPSSVIGGIQTGDFDGDGRLDIVTATTTAISLAHNIKPLSLDLINPAPSRLSNLSVLTSVSASNPVFTVGTVVGGYATSGPKPLLIRAAGPSLTPFGVGVALTDPKLDVLSGPTIVATNNNWAGTAALRTLFSQVGAFSFLSDTSLDAATAYTPTVSGGPGGLTVQVSGASGSAGAVLAEIYDATAATFTTTTPRLINVSVLKQIDAGEILTAGFVVQGLMPKQVLIRAVGPTLALAPFGVSGAMSDPKLDLFLGQTVIASNDNWGGTAALSSAFSSVGAFALGATSKDAALLVTLFPGRYTAQASGVAGATGVALVEVYELP